MQARAGGPRRERAPAHAAARHDPLHARARDEVVQGALVAAEAGHEKAEAERQQREQVGDVAQQRGPHGDGRAVGGGHHAHAQQALADRLARHRVQRRRVDEREQEGEEQDAAVRRAAVVPPRPPQRARQAGERRLHEREEDDVERERGRPDPEAGRARGNRLVHGANDSTSIMTP
ncbi:MAG TPA: hypothetical protein VMQ51_12490 [Candidatus Binatia bacterium]|nr:hypothetical protein [Candidatus Binatia bacterium]